MQWIAANPGLAVVVGAGMLLLVIVSVLASRERRWHERRARRSRWATYLDQPRDPDANEDSD